MRSLVLLSLILIASCSSMGPKFGARVPASEHYSNRPKILKITFSKDVSVQGKEGDVYVAWLIDKSGQSCTTGDCHDLPCALLSHSGNSIIIKKGTVLKTYAAYSDWEYSYVTDENQSADVEFNCGASQDVNLEEVNGYYKGLMKIEIVR